MTQAREKFDYTAMRLAKIAEWKKQREAARKASSEAETTTE